MQHLLLKIAALVAAVCVSAAAADAQVTLFTRTKPLPDQLPATRVPVDPMSIAGDPAHCTAALQPTADAQKTFIGDYVRDIEKQEQRNNFPPSLAPSVSDKLGLDLVYLKKGADYTVQVRALHGQAASLVPLWGCTTIQTASAEKLRHLGLYFIDDRRSSRCSILHA